MAQVNDPFALYIYGLIMVIIAMALLYNIYMAISNAFRKKKGGYHGPVDLPFNDSIINTNSELTYDISSEIYPFNNYQGRVR